MLLSTTNIVDESVNYKTTNIYSKYSPSSAKCTPIFQRIGLNPLYHSTGTLTVRFRTHLTALRAFVMTYLPSQRTPKTMNCRLMSTDTETHSTMTPPGKAGNAMSARHAVSAHADTHIQNAGTRAESAKKKYEARSSVEKTSRERHCEKGQT